ncbi:class I SAM-dependent methyltransferase [Pseudorhodoferax sp.]|uniref:class I SAM-dependent methyltransferase n=1 Tax=Pseudorhodoferax sp. TaxID=1993553 RepID=UPI002DD665E2|nr:class I SAM-dependent methyltransferase [Pseudorhodoferax sp.]
MPNALLLAIFVVLVANLAVSALLLRKVRRLDKRTWSWAQEQSRAFDNNYRQMESLLALYAELRPAASLPGTRGWAASPDFLLHIVRAANEHKPAVIVECSCGTSTLVLARACQLNGIGHVYSLEHEPQFAEITRGHLRRHGLDAWATVLDAPLATSPLTQTPWYTNLALPNQPIDMLIVDGPPGALAPHARHPAGPHLFDRLARGGRIYMDDMVRASEQETVMRWLQEFPGLQRTDLPAEKGACVLRMTGQAARA